MEYDVIIGNIAWFFLILVPLLTYNVDNVKFKEESLLMMMRNVLVNISVSHPVKQTTLNGFKVYIARQYLNAAALIWHDYFPHHPFTNVLADGGTFDFLLIRENGEWISVFVLAFSTCHEITFIVNWHYMNRINSTY